MKNVTKTLLVVTALLLALAVFTACDLFTDDCEHTGGEATCTEAAVCELCGESYGEALGHSFTNYVSNNNATCAADGTKTAKCDNCDVTDTIADEGSREAHTFDQENAELEGALAGAADCENAAVYYKSCSCGAISDSETFVVGNPLGHNYTEQTADEDHLKSAATSCQEVDVYWYGCTNCDSVSDELYYESENVGDHSLATEWTVEEGYHFHECTVEGCDYTEDNEACADVDTDEDHKCDVCATDGVTSHAYGNWERADDDNHKQTCNCGDVQTQLHQWNNGAVTKDPSHTEKGETTYTCTVCSDTYTDELPMITECTYNVEKAEDKYLKSAATCTAAAVYYKSCVCGKFSNAEDAATFTSGAALGHAYSVSYEWSDDNSTCAAVKVCANDAAHVLTEEVATVSTVVLKVTATKVTYTYNVEFANSEYAAQTKTVEAGVTLENSIATVNAPAIAGRVASHDYVKFGFHDATATYDFTIYYSECDVWNGTSVSTSLSGEGTEDNPYLIQSGADLAYIAKVVNDAAANAANFKGVYFKMTKSIDLNGHSLNIGLYSTSKNFAGNFDGNNCSIRGINSNQSLFGSLTAGYIMNLSAYGQVTSTTDRTGGILSYLAWSKIENVTNYVTVSGTSAVAGVVGYLGNTNDSRAINCVNYGNVNATSYQIGGIAGFAKGSISGCTNFGDVTSTKSGYVGGIGGATKDAAGSRSDCVNYGNIAGTDYVGGCFGQINKTTTNCYSYGTATAPTANKGEVVGSGASYLTYTE